jgi:fermentation-respiration switch protein FrsA (DUF1100 family)
VCSEREASARFSESGKNLAFHRVRSTLTDGSGIHLQEVPEMWPNKLLSIVIPLVGFYVLLVGALYILQRPMIFRADLSPAPPDLDSVPGFQEISYRTEDGLDLRALYRRAAPGKLTLVYFHGNADGLSGSLQVTGRLAAEGYGLLLVGYRGYDGNPGSPTEHGLYADGRSAIRWLSEHGVPSSDTVLVGNSLGSGPATELAANFPVAGLVLISGYTSLPDVGASVYPFIPVKLLMRDRFDNIGKIGRVAAPILILHGTADWTIPYDHAVALAAAAGNRAQVMPFEGIGHELVSSSALSPVIGRWLASTALTHLPSAPR